LHSNLIFLIYDTRLLNTRTLPTIARTIFNITLFIFGLYLLFCQIFNFVKFVIEKFLTWNYSYSIKLFKLFCSCFHL